MAFDNRVRIARRVLSQRATFPYHAVAYAYTEHIASADANENADAGGVSVPNRDCEAER